MILKKGLYTVSILLLLCTSCIQSSFRFEVESDTEIILPFAYGTYTLGDLFYDFEDTVIVSEGEFFRLSDTIPINDSTLINRLSELEIIFKATNFMPFQIDLAVALFDSITNTIIANSFGMTVVEPAVVDKLIGLIMPVYAENSYLLNQINIEEIDSANSLLIDAKFIWPYETVSAPLNDELKAFDLSIVLKAHF